MVLDSASPRRSVNVISIATRIWRCARPRLEIDVFRQAVQWIDQFRPPILTFLFGKQADPEFHHEDTRWLGSMSGSYPAGIKPAEVFRGARKSSCRRNSTKHECPKISGYLSFRYSGTLQERILRLVLKTANIKSLQFSEKSDNLRDFLAT